VAVHKIFVELIVSNEDTLKNKLIFFVMFTRKPGEHQRHFKPGNTVAELRQSWTFSQRLKDCLFSFRLSKTPHLFRFATLHNAQRFDCRNCSMTDSSCSNYFVGMFWVMVHPLTHFLHQVMIRTMLYPSKKVISMLKPAIHYSSLVVCCVVKNFSIQWLHNSVLYSFSIKKQVRKKFCTFL